MQRLAIAILLGIALYTGLVVLQFSVEPSAGMRWHLWVSVFHNICKALEAVAPGMLAGWVAGRSGFTVGLLVGVGAALVSPLAGYPFWGFMPGRIVLLSMVFGMVITPITQIAGGIAGAALRSRHVAL